LPAIRLFAFRWPPGGYPYDPYRYQAEDDLALAFLTRLHSLFRAVWPWLRIPFWLVMGLVFGFLLPYTLVLNSRVQDRAAMRRTARASSFPRKAMRDRTAVNCRTASA